MLRSTKELRGYHLEATDAQIGRIHGFLFDDSTWAIRYLVLETGSWLTGRRILLDPSVLGEPDWGKSVLPAALTRQQVEHSPDIDTDKPVSRQQQVVLHEHYGWPMYWAHPDPHSVVVLPAPAEGEAEAPLPDGDAHLRSTREVDGYRIQATDGRLGHVHDFIVDDDPWTIRYLVIDTADWLPGRKVLVAPGWVEAVSWEEAAVQVDATREQIRQSPHYDPDKPVNRRYEERLYDFHGRPRYWE